MNVAALVRVTALTTIIAVGAGASANAQTSVAPMATPGQTTQPAQSGMMGHGGSMMGGGGRMGGMSQMGGMRGGMMGGGHMMKVMFAIADTNGDGALSFDEVTAVHKRIFDVIDANKDGKVTRRSFRGSCKDSRARLARFRSRVEFQGLPRTYWLLLEPAEASVCLQHPGFEIDLLVHADIAAFYRVWLGRLTLSEAMNTGHLQIEGSASSLMGRDEEGTHRRFAALQGEVVAPAVGARGGTLVKQTGDGFLAEFASVVEAVRCGLEIQRGAEARNAGLAPERHIVFRIGINVGDIIIEGGDVFGDGVNVAARLEALAEPGGIVISRAVRDHVRDRLALSFEDMGERRVKNIARPVRAFRVGTDAGGRRAIPAAAFGASRRLFSP